MFVYYTNKKTISNAAILLIKEVILCMLFLKNQIQANPCTTKQRWIWKIYFQTDYLPWIWSHGIELYMGSTFWIQLFHSNFCGPFRYNI